MSESCTKQLEQLSTPENISSLRGIRRGIERETLRVTPDAHLAQSHHPATLGSALTHANITTDYSESLLEFITPVSDCTEILLNQLSDIHHQVTKQLDGELLWPMSMPCIVEDDAGIPLAQYGSSNIGKMKTLYREGLRNRYGSRMQVIAGVHYNFSMPDRFWSLLQKLNNNQQPLQDFISDSYMGLIRNFYRYGWLIPYLFGASPSICRSFVEGREQELPFESYGNGTLFLPHATALRMSRLGYTSTAQSKLDICHNSLRGYIRSLQQAACCKEPEFSAIGLYNKDGKRLQLNDNILQIENELYAPIRPKRTTKPGETPLEALHSRGIEYIEVRSLDINPFNPLGIGEEEIRFLDEFLIWCLLTPSAPLTQSETTANRSNFEKVVLEGRKSGLELELNGQSIGLQDWAKEIFNQLKPIAQLLDKSVCRDAYLKSWQQQLNKIEEPELTPSALLLAEFKRRGGKMTELAMELAQEYRQDLLNRDYGYFDANYFNEERERSLQQQRQIEATDNISFEAFLENYFDKLQGKYQPQHLTKE
ncbi:glutamate--cysteine ligase [Dongshaea marina]|uniref:glutamate--cysteine ligase n=1 Tax=Dongshaea marina TaxID=2047966 RepID=UPI001F247D05|nr:glutamate--cysteine ligase [Dongshaea marina]